MRFGRSRVADRSESENQHGRKQRVSGDGQLAGRTCRTIQSTSSSAAPASRTKIDQALLLQRPEAKQQQAKYAVEDDGVRRDGAGRLNGSVADGGSQHGERSLARECFMVVRSCSCSTRRTVSIHNLPRIGIPGGSRCMRNSNILVSAPVVKLPLTSFQKSAFFSSSLAK